MPSMIFRNVAGFSPAPAFVDFFRAVERDLGQFQLAREDRQKGA